jgi:transaldolase/glucose-6-phosphate isomerase
MNPLKSIAQYGQSVWLDYIRRDLITGGDLSRMIQEDGLRGVTSNPSIFEKAITGSNDYEDFFRGLERRHDQDAKSIYEALAVRDIQDAAGLLLPVYEKTRRRDGYVSLEVSPYLARDTEGTIAEARQLWKTVGRPNVLIKVPGTVEGIPAIERLIGEGINVNVTLLFSQEVYQKVAEAYMAGLEALAARGGDLAGVASVASFFVSRIDSAVDARLARRLQAGAGANEAMLKSLVGKIAIANARLAYQRYKGIIASARWKTLAKKGAQTQRLLWASTSTKNPAYRDVVYVEDLIGADTVNTMPPSTFEAFRDHGRPRPGLDENLEEAADTMATLQQVDISIHAVTDALVEEGVRLFADAFDKLLGAVEHRRRAGLRAAISRQACALPPDLDAAVKASLEEWRVKGKVRRLWARDASLWTGADEANWLGWLAVTDDQRAHLQHVKALAEDVRSAGFTHALLLGMGGSSLGPEVMRATFGRLPGFPELRVLDSTDPAQVQAFEKSIDPSRTLFIVASKSGSTLEPNIFKEYFFERARQAVGAAEAGRRFVAITDPASKMQQVAEGDGFRRVFFGVPSIGGRYSVLSDFGMVPSSVMGLDIERLLEGAAQMAHACHACVPPQENPGVVMGTVLGVAARAGRDKVTFITSPGLSAFGAWLEQLLAESTGKEGKGLIPVDSERPGPPAVYGNDRLFVHVRLEPVPDPAQDAAVDALERAGHPVVRIPVADPYDLGGEFFRWEIATAVAGSILGINPFNQPDVEASKIATRRLTSEYEQNGSLPEEKPILRDQGIAVFTDERNARALVKAMGSDRTLAGCLRAHLGRLGAGDYFAVLAYLEMSEAHEKELQTLRHAVRDARRTATCLGFGPRFLHSTGQAYKGGPNSGVFLQVTCDDAVDLPVPGRKYTFGVVKAAQARGDFEVLAERNRRALRVHLGVDVGAGLAALRQAVRRALD